MTLQPSGTKTDNGRRPRRETKRSACKTVSLSSHLQCGQNNLFHGGEVSFPEELRLLSEGQDLILVDGVHRGGNLQRTNATWSVLRRTAGDRSEH